MAEKRMTVAQRYQKRTPMGEIWYRLRKNKGAMIGLVVVIIMLLTALLVDVFLDYDTQVCGYNVLERLQGPSAKHPFGTDDMGRDMFYRVVYGTKYSMLIGISAVLFSLVFGLPYGAICGYFGGKVDLFLMRFMDILSAIPSLLLGIVVVAVLGPSITNLVIAIGIAQIPAVTNITRASVMTVRNSDYVESSRCMGLSRLSIITNHILPNCLSPILVRVTLGVANAIVSASGLSFLGLGVPVPSPEWGALLSAGRGFIRGYSYMTLFPGLAIMITVLALNLLGDGLRDALDPKLRR